MDEREPTTRNEAGGETAGGRLLLGWLLIIAGAVMLFAGWLGVSANPQVAVQLTYFVSGGLGGLLCGIIGVGMLVSDDVRKDRARIGRMEAAVLEMRELVAAQAETIAALSRDTKVPETTEPEAPTAAPADPSPTVAIKPEIAGEGAGGRNGHATRRPARRR